MKALLAKRATTTPTSADLGLLIIRLWFGLVMAFAHGAGKLFGDGPGRYSVDQWLARKLNAPQPPPQ